MWDAHVNHESDSHVSLQRRKIALFFFFFFFLYTSFGVRIAPGLISHVYDTGQLAVWHRKELAELVDYLPK